MAAFIFPTPVLVDQQLFFVTSNKDYDKLAHSPRGHAAKNTLRVYRFLTNGALVLLHIAGEGSKVINPVFSRFHPMWVLSIGHFFLRVPATY